MMATVMLGSLVVMVALTGVIMAVVPWLQRKNECFAVTVPESAQRDARLLAMKKRYTAAVLVLTLACCALTAAVPAFGPDPNTARGGMAFALVITVACLILCAVPFVLMLRYRKRVQVIKAEADWQVEGVRESAAVVAEDVPRAASLWWNVLYVPIILLTLGLGVAGYASMPDMVPMHMDFAGNVNDWAPKSPKVVLFPVLLEVFLAVCFVFCHWSIMRSKRPTDPWQPATSSLAYGMFARAQSVFLLVSGLVLCLVIGVGMQLSNMGVVSLAVMAVLVVGLSLLMVVGSLIMSVVYGQAGSRVFKRMQDAEALSFDDDASWKLGIFYFNREDPSLFLPERFGIGWTVNLARPAAWALLAGLVLVTVAFLVAVWALVG